MLVNLDGKLRRPRESKNGINYESNYKNGKKDL
jgi:hypothetical protein